EPPPVLLRGAGGGYRAAGGADRRGVATVVGLRHPGRLVRAQVRAGIPARGGGAVPAPHSGSVSSRRDRRRRAFLTAWHPRGSCRGPGGPGGPRPKPLEVQRRAVAPI